MDRPHEGDTAFVGPVLFLDQKGGRVALRYFSLDAGFSRDPMLDHLARRMGGTVADAALLVIRLHEAAARWADETGCLATFTPEALAAEIGWRPAAPDPFPALVWGAVFDK